MKLSELINYAENALQRFGDLDCFVDGDDDEDCCAELQELVCEIGDDGNKHILLTGFEIEFTQLRLVK